MQQKLKRMVVAYAVTARAVIADLTYKQASCTSQKDSNIACLTSAVAAVSNKSTEHREVQEKQRKIKKWKDSQRLAQD